MLSVNTILYIFHAFHRNFRQNYKTNSLRPQCSVPNVLTASDLEKRFEKIAYEISLID